MNRRKFFFCFVALASGILSFTVFPYGAVIIASLSPLALIKKKYFALVLALLFVFGGISASLSYREYQPIEDVLVTGTVTGISDGENKGFTLSDCTVIETNERIGKVSVSHADRLPECGDTLVISADLVPKGKRPANAGERDTRFSALADGISYYARAEDFEVLESETTISTLIAKIKSAVHDKIYSVIYDSQTASILYSFVTGDRTNVTSSAFDVFSSSGMAHLLALSGLHVGIIVMLLSELIGAFTSSDKFRFFFITSFLVLFCIFTGFSPSIVRASLMTAVLLFAKMCGYRYDLLNALSFSGTVILLANPYRLFDSSFMLSFSAMFGICVAPKFKVKNKLLAKVSSSITATLSTTVATLPVALYCFSKVPIAGIFCNVLLLPIASLAIALLFVSLIMPAPATIIPAKIIEAVMAVCRQASLLPKVTVPNTSGAWIIAFLALLFVLSRYSKMKNYYRLAVASLVSLAVFAGVIAENFDKRSRLELLSGTSDLCVHAYSGGHGMIGLDGSGAAEKFIQNNMRALDAVFVLDEDDVSAIERLLASQMPISAVFMPEHVKTALPLDVVPVPEGTPVEFGKMLVSFEANGIKCNMDGKNVFIGAQTDDDACMIFEDGTPYLVAKNVCLSANDCGMITLTEGKIKTFYGEHG